MLIYAINMSNPLVARSLLTELQKVREEVIASVILKTGFERVD